MNRNLKIWLILVLAAVLVVAVFAAFGLRNIGSPSAGFPVQTRPVQFTNPADIELFYIARQWSP